MKESNYITDLRQLLPNTSPTPNLDNIQQGVDPVGIEGKSTEYPPYDGPVSFQCLVEMEEKGLLNSNLPLVPMEEMEEMEDADVLEISTMPMAPTIRQVKVATGYTLAAGGMIGSGFILYQVVLTIAAWAYTPIVVIAVAVAAFLYLNITSIRRRPTRRRYQKTRPRRGDINITNIVNGGEGDVNINNTIN